MGINLSPKRKRGPGWQPTKLSARLRFGLRIYPENDEDFSRIALLILAGSDYHSGQTTKRSQHVERTQIDNPDACQLADSDDCGAACPGRYGGKSQDDAGCLPHESQFAVDRVESEKQSRSAHEPERGGLGDYIAKLAAERLCHAHPGRPGRALAP